MEMPTAVAAMKIPPHLRLLFWDTDLEAFDPLEYPVYTIERVLELGDEPAVSWLRGVFPQDRILDVLRTDRRLTPFSATFWAAFFEVPFEDIAALAQAP